jgi:hypothetical protein
MTVLYSNLSTATSGLLIDSGTSIGQKQLAAQLKKVDETGKAVTGEPLVSMKKNISAAAELLNKYQTSKDQEQLLLAQEQLLLFLKNYQRIGSE